LWWRSILAKRRSLLSLGIRAVFLKTVVTRRAAVFIWRERRMIRSWLRQSARKSTPPEPSQKKLRRRSVCLRLEELEDRSVPSALRVADPNLIDAIISRRADIPMLRASVISGTVVFSAGISDPHVAAGLDALLRDLQQRPSSPAASSTVNFNLQILVVDGASPPPNPAGPGEAGSPTPPTPIAEISPDSTNGETVGRTDVAPAPPATNPTTPTVPGPDLDALSQVARNAPPAPNGVVSKLPQPVTDNTILERRDGVRVPSGEKAESAKAPAVETRAEAQARQDAAVVHAARSEGAARVSAAGGDSGTTTTDLPDGMLLQRFAAYREQAAFTTLFQRHEQFVLNICQRVLGDPHAAEDALQATFLVLARKASTLDSRAPLAAWLFKVAYHLALRIRTVTARQRKVEKIGSSGRSCVSESESAADLEQQELRRVLYAELERLPEKYRAPLVLCYLNGRTHAEAAREIGLPRGSIAKRIDEALDVLRERLNERGLIA
jgi:RNA polymerase sigma factor (sigma-70 family)